MQGFRAFLRGVQFRESGECNLETRAVFHQKPLFRGVQFRNRGVLFRNRGVLFRDKR